MSNVAIFFVGLNLGLALCYAINGNPTMTYYWIGAAFLMGIIGLLSIGKRYKVCEDCGATAKLFQKIKHYDTCEKGCSEKWRKHYNEGYEKLTYRERQKMKIHSSHELGKEQAEILAPAGTPRFYGVRKCKRCGFSIAEHPAGLFIDEELFTECDYEES